MSEVAMEPLPMGIPGLRTSPWGLSAADQAQLLRSLRFRHFKWDAYTGGACRVLPEAMILSRETHREIVSIVEALNRGLGRFERRVRHDRSALRRLAIPEGLDPIIASEEEETLQLTRYDLFPCEDGRWMVSEFNEDVPGGFNEAAGLPELLGTPPDGLCWEGDLRDHFLRALAGYDSIALLYATAYAEDLQHVLILERWLSEAGHRTVLGSPAHLRRRFRRPRILGEPIDAAFRFYPAEWMPRLPNFSTWVRSAARLPMMNPFHRLIRQSKTMFALWREEEFLAAEDRELLEHHCPWTEHFDPSKIPMLKDERERWVLKGAFGRMGDVVEIGALCTEKEWDEALAHAARTPGEFCIQHRFVVRPLTFAEGPLYPAIGAYLVNGRFAGYYSRAAARPLITHEAFHVATLVETA
jgi:glutathionylspermidine synthase